LFFPLNRFVFFFLTVSVLSQHQLDEFKRTGHLTVPDVFSGAEIRAALDDLEIWSEEFLRAMTEEQRRWYLERNRGGGPLLRKLDNPVFHRPVFKQLAENASLAEMVEQLIGGGVSVFFSQVFMKPPEVGGMKPIHQDNFYFGPDDLDAMVTVWIALDEATTENGCLHYSNLHQTAVVPHEAPSDEPFNLQIPAAIADRFEMLPAPVPQGGVSFHHGNTPHQSSENRSTRPRRAVALHYMRSGTRLINPALEFDASVRVNVT
jgi:phytanoyl-CoA hydroxylase